MDARGHKQSFRCVHIYLVLFIHIKLGITKSKHKSGVLESSIKPSTPLYDNRFNYH